MNVKTKNHHEIQYINICPFPNAGLSNQLYLLMGAIIECSDKNIPVLIIGKFLLEINSNYYSNINKILYLPGLNFFIKKKYNVTLVDVSTTKYANNPHVLNSVSIPITMNRASELVNSEKGKYIINNLLFTSDLVSVPMKFLKSCSNNVTQHKIHVLHLRMEKDAIEHWSKVNNINSTDFQTKLASRYRNLIKQHIPKNELIILLSGSVNNEVTDFMTSNGYTYKTLIKQSRYREINAIMDMILGKMCNGVFIGAGGSTFSHILALSHHTDPHVKVYMIDINSI